MNDCPDFSIKYRVFPLTSALTTRYIFPDLVWKHRFPPTFSADLHLKLRSKFTLSPNRKEVMATNQGYRSIGKIACSLKGSGNDKMIQTMKATFS